MPPTSDKPTPKTLLPAVERKAPERRPDVTVPIDLKRLTKLLDETTPPPGDPPRPLANEFSDETRGSEPALPAQPTPATPEAAAEAAAEFDTEGASDGSSIAEALMRATGAAHAAVGEPAKRGDSLFEVRATPAEEPESPDELLGRAMALEAASDLEEAFEYVRRAQAAAPRRDDVAHLAQRLRTELSRRAAERVGDLRAVPTANPAEARGRGLPPRVAFLLAQVDGQRSFQQIIAVSGMRRDDALRTFAKLLADGLIVVKGR